MMAHELLQSVTEFYIYGVGFRFAFNTDALVDIVTSGLDKIEYLDHLDIRLLISIE